MRLFVLYYYIQFNEQEIENCMLCRNNALYTCFCKRLKNNKNFKLKLKFGKITKAL